MPKDSRSRALGGALADPDLLRYETPALRSGVTGLEVTTCEGVTYTLDLVAHPPRDGPSSRR